MSVPVKAQETKSRPILYLPDIPVEQKSTATSFLNRTQSLGYEDRQEVAVKELLRGNIPAFLKKLVSVQFRNAQSDTATVWVTADYLSIGTEGDFIRMPLSMPSAREIAMAADMYLPTAVMVDSIYAQAHAQLSPIPMTPGEQMRSNNYYRRHNEMIEEQLEGIEKGLLIAGHKKDLVVTNRLAERTGRVAIYGWHYAVDDPIQPVSTVHSEDYEDYSHGVRLLYPVAEVNGKIIELKKLINHPEWDGVFTKEKHIDIEFLSHGE
ncbi:hypothetical protein [Gracilimonas sp.]|uniref:hypothetical protein n=1 Tax=Gracilimonas sp. TaxID=1974203 RepID=UPI003BAA9B0A